jgi:hypothetical protein
LVARKDIFSDKSLMEFLELDSRFPEVQNKPLMLVGSHTENRSIMDFQWWPQSKMLFLVVSDLSTFIAKTSLFSFGKKKETVTTTGSLSGYLQTKKEGEIGDFHFEQQWWMNFPVAATALDWSPKMGIMVCGEDSGTLHFIKPSEADPKKYDELFFLKVHAERITRIIIDEDKKVVYSISEDRKFKETSIDKKRINNEFEVSSKRPNCMYVDKEQKVAYVGDAEGNVKVIDLAKNPPTCVNNIKVNAKDSISCIDVSGTQIFAACEATGKILVYTLSEPKNSVQSFDSEISA